MLAAAINVWHIFEISFLPAPKLIDGTSLSKVFVDQRVAFIILQTPLKKKKGIQLMLFFGEKQEKLWNLDEGYASRLRYSQTKKGKTQAFPFLPAIRSSLLLLILCRFLHKKFYCGICPNEAYSSVILDIKGHLFHFFLCLFRLHLHP